ncbi:GAF domain-containing protein [Novosphingobium sp. 1949]|uniref:GAF domain-containing protein n=1 Tax=Novosphingobium organovorum TaxID=2930092 RepID=A0ABT0BJ83_9SPHN|nr:GAF domain-containing protein [Novosphingobium organovorum]MCJ2185121.1 GAF domain-containing protein [Novosphingobium organovorum]
MDREPFIRATEIWVPAADGRSIDLQSGVYGQMDYFAAVSRGMRFELGEGLPGKVWEQGRPIILRDLCNSYFVRKEAAMTEGLSCAVAMPSYDAGRLRSVTVLFCGDDRFRLGALELWTLRSGEDELSLVDGYFGHAHEFESETRDTRFASGEGVPGRAWRTGRPDVLASLGSDGRFLRHEAADQVGFDRAVGVPCPSRKGVPFVLTLVSSCVSPVAGRIEYWVLDEGVGGFRLVSGYCEACEDLLTSHADTVIAFDVGLFGRACRKRIPLIDEDLATDTESRVARSAVAAGLKSMVVQPLNAGDGFDAVLVWYF